MLWVTWRQHRVEALFVLIVVALISACAGLIIRETIAGACLQNASGYCFPNNGLGGMANSLASVNFIPYALAVLPGLAGAFIAAPLIAREIEQGTERLAWTQGVTRLKWLSAKLILVFVPLLLAAAVLGIVEMLLINAQGYGTNHWNFFDQQAPVTVAATALALALGLAAGSVIGKAVPAMAATLITFVVVRVAVGELARPHYAAPLSIPAVAPVSAYVQQTSWWLNQNDQVRGLANTTLYYQPAGRFWAFQVVESGILVGLAAIVFLFAVYWISRRVS